MFYQNEINKLTSTKQTKSDILNDMKIRKTRDTMDMNYNRTYTK